MDAPKCRICDKKHYGMCKGVVKTVVKKPDHPHSTFPVGRESQPPCSFCHDRALRDHLAAEKEKARLRKRKQRSKG